MELTLACKRFVLFAVPWKVADETLLNVYAM